MNKLSVFRENVVPQKESNRFLGRVYAMEYGDFLKIGSSKKLTARIRALKKQCEYASIQSGEVVFTSPHTNYKENEKLIHMACSEYRIGDTELYDLNIYDFIEVVSKLHAKDDSVKLSEECETISDYFISLVTNRG